MLPKGRYTTYFSIPITIIELNPISNKLKLIKINVIIKKNINVVQLRHPASTNYKLENWLSFNFFMYFVHKLTFTLQPLFSNSSVRLCFRFISHWISFSINKRIFGRVE